MRAYKPTYKNKKGETKQVSKWWVELRDHLGNVRRFPAFTDKGESEKLGRKIERLVVCKLNNDPPDRILSEWLENTSEKLRNKLVEIGLLDSRRAAASKSLMDHLKDFENSLQAKGSTEKHAKQTTTRIERIIKECEFTYWSDITASRVLQKIVKFRKYVDIVKVKKVNGKKVKKKARKDNGQIASRTANYYLKSMKQFCRWMVTDRRAIESPIEHLACKPVKKIIDEEHPRRALEIEDLIKLLETTKAAPKRFGMNGNERYLLYRLAAETGLRANEIRSLKISSFDFKNLTVKVLAESTKNKQEAIQQLRQGTASELKEFFKGKLPNIKAFGGTYKQLTDKTSNALKADLTDAGIPYVFNGLYFDFHALRHQTGTLLANSGVMPKVAQTIMRHSNINLTMNNYTHILTGQESEAVAKLPDLSLPSQDKQKSVATGTNGKSDLAGSLAFIGGHLRTSANSDELVVTCINKEKAPFPAQNQRFQAKNKAFPQRGRRDSNPQPSDRQSDALTN